ncbi:MAG: hypothetical protein ACKOBF_13155, partial [Limnohabitans sp.]
MRSPHWKGSPLSWAREYRGDLGIALSDVYGFNAFLRDVDMYFCKLFDGTRHYSACPIQCADIMIDNYSINLVHPRHRPQNLGDCRTDART